MPKKKKPEPERFHPYIPADTKELFGYEILWLPPTESIDYTTTSDDSGGSQYKEEYHGKIVVCEAMDENPENWVNDPLIFDENGHSYYNVPRVAVEGFLEEASQYAHAAAERTKAKEEASQLRKQLGDRTDEVVQLKELVEAAKEDVEHWKAEAEKHDVDGGTNNLRSAVGGDPKEVSIKW